ncbi:response regulator transcription factor [Pedobacter xixiisoli]|uniref:Two component transcriptional regulator, LuxR family n=1 Tax=Pedobacter xixiisoli TaxID=1476464 RepID=A0A285ZWX5_9SPHI|nr:response regulator transcription factor [Pedobacter xixiisoli]SOD14154.1 two component transcriptional regulator, LuxR family [Pedobacter xixiisoli]
MAQNNNKVVNILLADDHHLVRDGIKSLIEKYSEFKVVGEGADGAEIIEILETTEEKIDLVLADINMPNMSGLELSEAISVQYPTVKVLILSMLDHEKYVSQALQSGAKGYLLKSVNEEELIFAIKQVMSNSFYVCSELTHQLLSKSLLGSGFKSKPSNGLKVDFSSREIEILELIAEGYTNLEIADKLFTSKRTIEGHRLQMIAKTGVRNTAALVKFCITNGVLHYV